MIPETLASTPWSGRITAGDSLRDSGNVLAAIAHYREIIADYPTLALAHYKLGTAYMRLEKVNEAEACFRSALRLQPDLAVALNNLGLLMMGQENTTSAEIFFRKSLASDSSQYQPHLNLGNLLRDTYRDTEAEDLYKRATELNPNYARTFERLGVLYLDQGKTSHAISALRRAVTLDPLLTDGWIHLGVCHIDSRELEEAQDCCKKAIAAGTTDIAAWHNLLLIDNWLGTDRSSAFANHQAFGAYMADLVQENLPAVFKNPRINSRRLKIGYVSGDFRRHSVAFFVEGLLTHLDRSKFELFAYYTCKKSDHKTEQFVALFDHWRNVFDMETDAISQSIKRDQVDILFDLSGHTGNNRLGVLANRAAPVQVSWIGYPNTTGLRTMDYRITDEICEPEGESDNFHSEKLVRLPSTFLCYTPPVEAPDVASRPLLTSGQVTFGSFNSRIKISDQTLRLWAAVLNALPASRLLLKSIRGINDDETRETLIQQARRNGVDVDRFDIVLSKPMLEDHLAMYGEIDICLDTVPYNGTTTTCEALWMGVPVIALTGDRHASRVSASLLANVGLADLVATSEAEYIRIAVELANDQDRRSTLRRTMRGRMRNSVLLDAPRFASVMGDTLREMWVTFCEQSPLPASVAEQPVSDSQFILVAGGHQVCIEANPFHSITSWVLLEQEDWFEDEIRFLRKVCKTNWHALDIGANHGVYALALASAGARKIWAFDPSPQPMAMLRKSIERNEFQAKIELVPTALSDQIETMIVDPAQFSELTMVSKPQIDQDMSKTGGISIRTTTLDEFAMQTLGDTMVDFIKLDAEGSEIAILDGGKSFFNRHSPLVMFECRHGSAGANTALIAKFRSMNFGIYKLIDSLGVLIPVSAEQANGLDPFTLNLFACSPEKAETLQAEGTIISGAVTNGAALAPEWLDLLYRLPVFSTSPKGLWDTFDFGTTYGQALVAWCGSKNPLLATMERLGLLQTGLSLLQQAMEEGDSHPAVAALGIRLCADIGMRAEALELASSFLEQIPIAIDFPEDRPVPPPYDKFDSKLPTLSLGQLLHQSVVEFRLDRSAHSTVFSKKSRAYVGHANVNPEHSARFVRTTALVNAILGITLRLHHDAKLFHPSYDNMNWQLWRKFAKNGEWISVNSDAPW
ncbi:MAG: FkbM family methyltransferase [Rhodocyclaceae bacterium]|nr:FkbM family methyltransferase [Rhodocyclaceae bacterium]